MFPGMNPYLESQGHWHSFHTGFMVYTAEALNGTLPAGYVAVVEQRLAILPDVQTRYADLGISVGSRRDPVSDRGRIAVAERGAPTGEFEAVSDEVYERFVEIRSIAADGSRVITILELLSPSNKAGGTLGRREYLDKQRELLHSGTHLLEIDLLRSGAYTVAMPIEGLPPRSEWDYIVSLHHASRRFHYAYWLFRLEDRLPEVRVPLYGDDPDIFLDLQAVFHRTYTAGRFEQQIDFTAPLPDGERL